MANGSGLATSRTRIRDAAEAYPAREQGLRSCRGLRALETPDRKVDRVPVLPGTATATDDLDECGDDEGARE
jgi:hypothetical protein